MERPLQMEPSSIFPWDKVKKTMLLKLLKKLVKPETGACSRTYISCRHG